MIRVPDIMKGRTGYLVMVDRFCRVGEALPSIEGRKLKDWNDSVPDWQPDKDGVYRNQYFYGGNLKGVASKIDYFDKLGVDLVFLSPISRTTTYHHYDVQDQRIIDPYIGDWDDFCSLAKALHVRNMLLGVDLVFNHMGADSEFFKKALAGDKKYRDWFEWDKTGLPKCWSGFKDMPQCNKLNSSYQEYCCEVVELYAQNGADVIRLDLGENLPREFLLKIRAAAKRINPNVVIASEMWRFALEKPNPQIYDQQVDSVMNYPLTDAILRWIRYGNYLHFNACMLNLAKYPLQVNDVLLNYLSTHDTHRERTMLAGEGMIEDPFSGFIWDIDNNWRGVNPFPTYELRKWEYEHDSILKQNVSKVHKLAALMLYLMKGVPVTFYGSEDGMSGYKDPFCRKPKQWNSGNEDMLNFYIALGAVRKNNRDVLSTGESLVFINANAAEIIRRSENGIVVAFLNRSETPQELNAFYPGSKEIFSLEGSTPKILAPYGAYVCRF